MPNLIVIIFLLKKIVKHKLYVNYKHISLAHSVSLLFYNNLSVNKNVKYMTTMLYVWSIWYDIENSKQVV